MFTHNVMQICEACYGLALKEHLRLADHSQRDEWVRKWMEQCNQEQLKNRIHFIHRKTFISSSVAAHPIVLERLPKHDGDTKGKFKIGVQNSWQSRLVALTSPEANISNASFCSAVCAAEWVDAFQSVGVRPIQYEQKIIGWHVWPFQSMYYLYQL